LDSSVAFTGDAALSDGTAGDGAHFDGAADRSESDAQGGESSDGIAGDGAHFDGAADGSGFDAQGNESGDSMGRDAGASSNCPPVAPSMGDPCTDTGVTPGTTCEYSGGQTCACVLPNGWLCGFFPPPPPPPFDAGSCPTTQPSPAEPCAIPGQPPCAYSNNVNCFCVFDSEGGAGRWNCL
jgi:hypothetical protein